MTAEEVKAAEREIAALYERMQRMTPEDMVKRVIYLEGMIYGMTGGPADYPTPEGGELDAA